jgi:hypothetical protein
MKSEIFSLPFVDTVWIVLGRFASLTGSVLISFTSGKDWNGTEKIKPKKMH